MGYAQYQVKTTTEVYLSPGRTSHFEVASSSASATPGRLHRLRMSRSSSRISWTSLVEDLTRRAFSKLGASSPWSQQRTPILQDAGEPSKLPNASWLVLADTHWAGTEAAVRFRRLFRLLVSDWNKGCNVTADKMLKTVREQVGRGTERGAHCMKKAVHEPHK